MKFNSEINHPYRNIVEYLNVTEEANLIDDFLHYISVIEFNDETSATKDIIRLKDTDLREHSQVMDVYDFINFLTHRYIDAIKIILLNNNISRTEILIRLGEFRERIIEHWQSYSEVELSLLKMQFTTDDINPVHIKKMKNNILMEQRLPAEGMVTKRDQSLKYLCAFYFEEEKNPTSIEDKRNDAAERYHHFNANVLPETGKILTPYDNLDYLGFLQIPNDPTTLHSVIEYSPPKKIADYVDVIVADITADIQMSIKNRSKQVSDQDTLFKNAQSNLDKVKMFPYFIIRKDYLQLDKEYNSYTSSMDNKKRAEKAAAFSKQRKRHYKVVHPTSYANWSKTADYKKSDHKPIGHTNGVLTLCYWQLYYYNLNLFKDLKKLEVKSDFNTFIHLMWRYYIFIEEDLLLKVVDLIVSEHDFVKSEIRNELRNVNKEIGEEIDSKKRTPLINRQNHLLEEIQKYTQSSSSVRNYCKNIIRIHFNHSLVEQIIKVYTTSSTQHKLLLETYENEYKVINLL